MTDQSTCKKVGCLGNCGDAYHELELAPYWLEDKLEPRVGWMVVNDPEAIGLGPSDEYGPPLKFRKGDLLRIYIVAGGHTPEVD